MPEIADSSRFLLIPADIRIVSRETGCRAGVTTAEGMCILGSSLNELHGWLLEPAYGFSLFSLLSLFSASLSSALSLSFWPYLIRDPLFQGLGMGRRASLSLSLSYVMHVIADLLDKFGEIPYPEGIRGGRVNTNIWQLGLGISLINKKAPNRANLLGAFRATRPKRVSRSNSIGYRTWTSP